MLKAIKHCVFHKYITKLGRKDSNLRIAGSKPAALPLGDAPKIKTFLKYILKISFLTINCQCFNN